MPEKASENPPFSLSDLELMHLKAYPDQTFPKGLDPRLKQEALLNSKGRRIIFSGNDRYFFEDETQEESPEIKDLKRFLGCGG